VRSEIQILCGFNAAVAYKQATMQGKLDDRQEGGGKQQAEIHKVGVDFFIPLSVSQVPERCKSCWIKVGCSLCPRKPSSHNALSLFFRLFATTTQRTTVETSRKSSVVILVFGLCA